MKAAVIGASVLCAYLWETDTASLPDIDACGIAVVGV